MSRSELEFIEVEPTEEIEPNQSCNYSMDLSLLSNELVELKELMIYTANLVNESGEGIIRVRANVEAVHQEVVIGEQELRDSTKEQSTNRRMIGKIVVGSTFVFLGIGGATALLCTGSGAIAIGAMALGGLVAGAGTHYFI